MKSETARAMTCVRVKFVKNTVPEYVPFGSVKANGVSDATLLFVAPEASTPLAGDSVSHGRLAPTIHVTFEGEVLASVVLVAVPENGPPCRPVKMIVSLGWMSNSGCVGVS